MRLIDADKLYPDCMTKNGTLAISQSQIANAPTVEERPPHNAAVDLAIKALETTDDPDLTSNGSRERKTMFDDCYPCTNCQEFECDGCVYDLMHKGNR